MNASILRFGDFRLDKARRELWGGDERLRLPVRVYECIAYLASHHDRAVGRDELIRAIWGEADVSDNVLDQTVLRARRILGDTGRQRRIILTKPRFGYVWGIPVEVLDDESDRSGEGPDGRPAGASVGFRWRVGLLAAFGLAASALLVLQFWDSRDAPPASASRALVLPVTIDAGEEHSWIRLGLMDLIAQRLRSVGLAVVPSDNVVALLQETDDPSAERIDRVAEMMAAGLVLSAQAHQGEGNWRVTLRLLRDSDEALTSIGESPDLLSAARIATDIMARHMGFTVAPSTISPGDEAIAGLLQQVDAAMLADDMETANALLERIHPDLQARPDVRYQQAMVDFRLGRLKVASQSLEALLQLDRVRDDKRFHARVLNALSNVRLREGEFGAAEGHVNAAISQLGDDGPSRELGRSLTGRAVILSSQGRFADALTDFARARVVLESVGDRFALARVDANIGILETRRDRLAEALPILSSAAESLAEFHDLSSELYTRVALASVHLLRRDPASALSVEPRLRELRADDPDPARRRYAGLTLSQILLAAGRLRDGDELLQQVIQEADSADDRPIAGLARAVAAIEAHRRGDSERAFELASNALHHDREDERLRVYHRARLLVLKYRLERGDVDGAQDAADAFSHGMAADASPVARLYTELASAAVARDDTEAAAAFERALLQAESSRVPDDLLQVSSEYADFLIERGRLGRAGEVVARTADWADRDYQAALLQLRLYHALARPSAWHQSLKRVQALAGERRVPPELLVMPTASN